MKATASLLAALLIVASSFYALPASAAVARQITGNLPKGGSYVLVRDSQIAAASISVWFRAPSDGYAGRTPGMSRLAATAAAATTLASGTSFAEMVRRVGGRLSIEIYPDIIGVNALVPSTAARRVVAAISAAYFTPSITNAGLKIAQRDASVQAISQRYSAAGLVHNALFAQIFSSGPAHIAPTPDAPAAFMQISLASVQRFAQRTFRSSNATLTLVGNIDASSLTAVVAGGRSAPPNSPIDSTVAVSPSTTSQVTASVSGAGLAWVGPPIANEEAATALDFVSDYLFRDGTGIVAKAVGAGGNTYVSGQFITLHNPGVMLVTIGGAHPVSAQATVLAALKKMTQPLDPATFRAARNAFLYHLAVDTQTPAAQADNLGWYAAEGNASYAPGDANGRYVATARALDPAFVASIVKKYLTQPVIVRLSPDTKEST